jgi:hypothetical protein
MKRILATIAVVLAAPAVAMAAAFSTTGGYGNAVIDSSGAGYSDTEGLKPTYSYQSATLTPVATATDVVTLTGSASKTIRVTKVCASGIATAASVYDIFLIKRTTADTGGTSTTPTPVQHDSNDAAASGTINLYTANPTLGTGIAVRGSHMILANASTPAWQVTPTCWQFGDSADEKVALRGVAQQFAINHGGAAVPTGASVMYTIEWVSEP